MLPAAPGALLRAFGLCDKFLRCCLEKLSDQTLLFTDGVDTPRRSPPPSTKGRWQTNTPTSSPARQVLDMLA
ncbi:hypothetical protein VULLAG_LOCUS22518 [Vulpes lagopus]